MFAEKIKKQPEWVDYALLEMSIIPIPHEWKRPDFKWGKMKWTKLHVLMDTDNGIRTLAKLFELGGGGLAVVCGRPSENLFVIDCDTLPALEAMRRQLIARGIDAPCVFSSRGGHLYLRAREGAVKTVNAGTLADVEIRGDGAIAVLPPTRHKSGIYYTWDGGRVPQRIPTISVDDIDFLTGVDGKHVKLSVAGGERRLHDRTRDYLADGSRLPQGQRNSRLFDAARDYKYVGKDSSDALHDLLPIAVQSGLGEKDATATILSPFKATTGNKPKTANKSDELLAFMLGVSWDGRTGKTDRRVFEALIQRRRMEAYRRKDGVFRASHRELMLMVRIDSIGTINRSLARLKATGYIEAVGKDSNSTAGLYRFTDLVLNAGQFFLVQNWNIKQQVSSLRDYCSPFAQLSEKSALGPTAVSILNLLRKANMGTTPWADSRDIAAQVGVVRTTADRNLKKLLSAGVIEKVGNKYRAIEVTAAQERALVVDSGAYAADKARQARMDRDRAYFALNRLIEYLWNKNLEGKSS